MKLRNKKTGKIVDVRMSYREDTAPIVVCETTCDENGQSQGWPYNSLAELNAEWEDYEEPKEHWYIYGDGCLQSSHLTHTMQEEMKQIGNYFGTREEADRAVEKLKAWKRLKDRNLRFNLNYSTGGATINHKDVIMCRIEAYFDDKWEEENMKAEEDLDLLLGGEE